MDPENGTAIGSDSWVTGVDVGNYPQPRYLYGWCKCKVLI